MRRRSAAVFAATAAARAKGILSNPLQGSPPKLGQCRSGLSLWNDFHTLKASEFSWQSCDQIFPAASDLIFRPSFKELVCLFFGQNAQIRQIPKYCAAEPGCCPPDFPPELWTT